MPEIPRKSLAKSPLEARDAIEVLALLQTVTDGRFGDGEGGGQRNAKGSYAPP